jgi:DNA-binding transcriptional LysR family regulator
MRLRSPGLVSTTIAYFQAVARLGSIRAAAEALNVAPSAVSRQILKLEEEMGASLFERLPRGLRLTSAGEILLHHSRASGTELERARNVIEEMRGLKRGRVALAVVESAAAGFLPNLLEAFWKRYPRIKLDLTVVGSARALHAVADGEADLALAFDVATGLKLRERASATLRIGAVMSPKHALAQSKSLRFRDFIEYDVFLSDMSLTMGASIEAAMYNATIPLSARVVTNSIQLMNLLAASDAGVAFETRLGTIRDQARGELVFVPLAEPRLKPQRLGLYTRSEGRPSAAAEAFAKALAEALGKLDEA